MATALDKADTASAAYAGALVPELPWSGSIRLGAVQPLTVHPTGGMRDFKHSATVGSAARAQAEWKAVPIAARIALLKRARRAIAMDVVGFTSSISPSLARNPADTIAAEVLPLLAACKFLEQRAASILAVRKLRSNGRPLWLAGVESEIEQAALGTVLIIAPSNYPLLLAGVQTLQALVAGNAVVWKPGCGGEACAVRLAEHLYTAGLPRPLLQITGESVEAAQQALRGDFGARPAKVFFTGSAVTGRKLMTQLAETLTPSVMELSGCDAVFVLRSADLVRVAQALAFGMRLNGSATCMAPRRCILIGANRSHQTAFAASVVDQFEQIEAIRVNVQAVQQVTELIAEAVSEGAVLHGTLPSDNEPTMKPVLLTGVRATMRLAQADIFYPVLMLMTAANVEDALALEEACPFALTASVFGAEQDARGVAAMLNVGTVVVNDLIVPTADPRVPFGGRKRSGFGSTRGAEGLLEMTAPKVTAVRRGRSVRHFERTQEEHADLFGGLVKASHGGSIGERLTGLKQLIRAARGLSNRSAGAARISKESKLKN